MTYTRGDNRRLIDSEAHQHGWTVSPEYSDGYGYTVSYQRRKSNITVRWTPRDTVTYASINIQGQAGRVSAAPRMALVQTRQWLSAPGESEVTK